MFTKLRILGAALAMLINSAAYADLAIIGHPDYNTGELDIQSVKNLFLGERKAFPNGLNATPINHVAGSPDRKEFFLSVLSMVESSHVRHWTRKRASGGASSPVELNSHDAILHEVANTPGGISYIDASLVDNTVKVLLTINSYGDV